MSYRKDMGREFCNRLGDCLLIYIKGVTVSVLNGHAFVAVHTSQQKTGLPDSTIDERARLG